MRLLRLALTSGVAIAAPVAAEMSIALDGEAQAARSVQAAIRFTGSGGFDLGGVRPRAWLVPSPTGTCAVPTPDAGARALDGNLLVFLNDDATISAVDPQRNLASSNIAWLARMPEQPSAWFLDTARGTALVALPRAGLRWIDLGDGKTLRDASLDRHVTTLIAAPEIGAVWAITDKAEAIQLDANSGARRSGLPAGDALQWIGHRHLLATATARRLTLFAADGTEQSKVVLPHPARAMAASMLADSLYLLSEDGSAVMPVPLDAPRALDPIAVTGKADMLLASPDGRWLFAIERGAGLVSVVDTAEARLTRVLHIHAGVTHAAFSDAYLYLREAERAFATLVRLSSLADAKEHVVAIPVGLVGGGGPLAPLGGDGMALLNKEESSAYLYMESGMADGHGTMRSPTEMLAPYAAVKLRGGAPTAIVALSQGLKETAPGRFTVSVRPEAGGPWRLVVREAMSEETACLDFIAAGPSSKAHDDARLRLGPDDAPYLFRLVDPKTGDAAPGPPRLALLAFAAGSNWQAEIYAARQQDGRYRLESALPGGTRIALVPLDPGFDKTPLMLETK